jgi:ATP-dependent exoDNAse (exonuclease V) beta subunit
MSDAIQRALFCKDIHQDFSLIAPAGVGKTYSIVERIFTLAQEIPEELPALCVITYTRKAAETLRVRTFERLKQLPNFKHILPLLKQSFFMPQKSSLTNGILKFFCVSCYFKYIMI